MKKFFAMLLSLVMLMSLSVPAFAADVTIGSTEDDGSNSASNIVTATYIPQGQEANITGVSISGGASYDEATNTYIVTPDSGDVTITITGTNLQNGTFDNFVYWGDNEGFSFVTSGYGWTFKDDGTTATISVPVRTFATNTTATEVWYSNNYNSDDSDENPTGIYTIYQSSVSVDITWGALSFTYDDTVDENSSAEKGWNCDEGANKVTVANSGADTITAAVEYSANEGYAEISGSFDTGSAMLVTNEEKIFTLTLNGKPGKTLIDDAIGSVTVTITEATAKTHEELAKALSTGGTVKLGADFELTNSISITNDVVLDLNGCSLTAMNNVSRLMVENGTLTIMDSGTGGSIANEYIQAVNVNGGNLIVNGGNISSTHYGVYVLKGTATVNGGTIDYLLPCPESSSVTITGGKIKTANFDYLEGSTTVTITGGTFGCDVSEYVDTSNYTVNYNNDGTWTVLQAQNG